MVVEEGQEEVVMVVVGMNISCSLNFCLEQFSDGIKTRRTKCLTAKGLTLIRLIFVALKVCAWVFRRYQDTVLATYVVPSHLAVSFSIFSFRFNNYLKLRHIYVRPFKITVYFIHPSGKLNLSSDRTTKNISQ